LDHTGAASGGDHDVRVARHAAFRGSVEMRQRDSQERLTITAGETRIRLGKKIIRE